MIPNPFEKNILKPGLIDDVLTGLSELDDGNAYRLAADARKISREKRNVMGDDDLFGFEQEVLSEKLYKLAVVKELVSTTCDLQEECNCKYVSKGRGCTKA